MRGGSPDVAYGMHGVGGDEYFPAGFGVFDFPLHFKLYSAINENDDFVHRMHEILPNLSRRIGPQIEGVDRLLGRLLAPGLPQEGGNASVSGVSTVSAGGAS